GDNLQSDPIFLGARRALSGEKLFPAVRMHEHATGFGRTGAIDDLCMVTVLGFGGVAERNAAVPRLQFHNRAEMKVLIVAAFAKEQAEPTIIHLADQGSVRDAPIAWERG